MPFLVGETVEITGGQYRAKSGVVTAVLPASRYTVRINVQPPVSPSLGEKDLQRPKWDHKHGLAPKAQPFAAAGGALAGGASLANKKVHERVLELFGKPGDPRGRRLSGLPTHVAALNNELNPPANAAARVSYDADAAQYKTVEQEALKTLERMAREAGIDFPPVAVIFPLLGRVVVLHRKNGQVGREEAYFATTALATARAEYVMDGGSLGTYYADVPAYANAAHYRPVPPNPPGTWVRTLMEQGLADGY